VRDELEQSGMFGQVARADAGGRGVEHLEITINNTGNMGVALATGVLSGLTLTVLPGYARDKYELTAALVRNGVVVANYRFEARVSTWIELFLVFGMPFSDSPSSATEATILNCRRPSASRTCCRQCFASASAARRPERRSSMRSGCWSIRRRVRQPSRRRPTRRALHL
jgi:hypothetical protein